MKGRVLFRKYIASLLAVVLIGLLLLVAYLAFYTASYFSRRQVRDLAASAAAVRESVEAMMDISRQDFEGLVEEHRARLTAVLTAQRLSDEATYFITNNAGRVLIATDPALEGKCLESGEMSVTVAAAREGQVFSSRLAGVFDSERVCRVVLMEKSFSETSRQRVGAVFLTLPAGDISPFAKNLLISFFLASFLILVAVLFASLWIAHGLVVPLTLLNEAAAAYARGDLGYRIPEERCGELTPLVRALNQMASRAQDHEKSRQTFISDISHDLRTPLTTIGGFVQNMMEGAIPPERQNEYFAVILDEVQRLSRLVQTLLETSRLTTGQTEYVSIDFDLCELGRITLLSFEKRLEAKKVAVSFVCERDSMAVTADRDAITRVIYNLIDNAVKFIPDEGELTVRVASQGREKVLFSVKNTGAGISQEEIAHLFDRFYKSDTSRGLDKAGMGLGLFIARSIIEAHGEEIWVESMEGEYTEFLFSLPAAPTAPRTAIPKEKER